MNDLPPLPSDVSRDGREIWDWAARLSEHTQRMHRLRELNRKIAATGTCCGDCDHWMKSRVCPRERNVNGFSKGPSCEAPICRSFKLSKSAAQFRDRWIAERDASASSEGGPSDG